MDLDFENRVALDLMQALLGTVSPNIRGVSFECINKKVIVHYLIAEDSMEDREEAEDLLAEFEALQPGPFDISCVVTVSSAELSQGVGSLKGRPIYARKEN
ncbi:hypothetical protein NBRC116494_02640 [Aurantivibrio plasticivorans]